MIKSFLWPILGNEQQIEPRVIKNANQFVSFKFSDVQLLDIMNFFGGATSLDSFLEAFKTEETKSFPLSNGSTIPKSGATKNYLHTILSFANCVILILSKTITTPERSG